MSGHINHIAMLGEGLSQGGSSIITEYALMYLLKILWNKTLPLLRGVAHATKKYKRLAMKGF